MGSQLLCVRDAPRPVRTRLLPIIRQVEEYTSQLVSASLDINPAVRVVRARQPTGAANYISLVGRVVSSRVNPQMCATRTQEKLLTGARKRIIRLCFLKSEIR